VRNTVRKKLTRGHADVFVSLKDKRERPTALTADMALAASYVAAAKALKEAFPDLTDDFTLTSLLRYPVVLKQEDTATLDEGLIEALKTALSAALDNLNAMRLIEGGCDPMMVARRLVIHSAEDVGMADPQAMIMASNAMYILSQTGYPEGLIPLSNAIIYVCEAPKSNSVVNAMHSAQHDAKTVRDDQGVPPYLKDNSYGDAKAKSDSANYKYPHNYEGGYVVQQYLPDALKDKIYYVPSDYGFEKTIKEIRKAKGKLK
jgi:hypothetical protein